MKKILFSYSFLILCFTPLNIIAATASVPVPENSVTLCKQEALQRRNKIMTPALREYVTQTEIINNKAKKDFESIKWYVGSSYTIASKKIQNNKNQELASVNKKIADVRLSAQATQKAEEALCDFYNNKGINPIKK